MLYVKLLGAPSLAWNGKPFVLPRRQARALLYRLAADAQPVAREQLIFLFWPDVPDARARKNLSRLASYLTNVLPEAGLLQAGRDSIGLDRARTLIDVQRFERLAGQDDAAGLEEAVALYDGTFLSGFYLANTPEYENWTAPRAERLQSIQRSALARLVQLKESAGDLAGAIGYGQRYLAHDDLAEEMHRQLIHLYSKNGDRAAALRQYELCVAVLERELGVAPLPETRQAYEAALTGQVQAVIGAPEVAANWTVLPSLELPLIGRDDAYSLLERAYGGAPAGSFVFISGEPGIGKSRLLREFATERDDHLVMSGACYRNGHDLPFQPLVQALRPALSDEALWQSIRPIWLAELAAILPEVHEHFDDLPPRLQIQPDQAQARIFEALTQVLSGLASRRPVLLGLDDLHWADEATVAWLTYLAGRGAANARIIATFRTHEAGALIGLREALDRAGLQTEVALAGLSVDAIEDIISQLPPVNGGRPSQDRRWLAAEVHRVTSGNAFFVLETLRNLLEKRQLGEPPATLPLAPTVQEAIRGRLERLDPLSRQVLDAAAVVSPSISFDLVGPVAGRSESEIVDALETLLARQLLVAPGEDLQFQHELGRVVVYEELSPWRRRLLHGRAAETLVEAYRGRSRQVAARIARHYEAAAKIDLAKRYYREAAGVAQEQYAYQEANRYLRRIIEMSSEESDNSNHISQLYEALGNNSKSVAAFDEAEMAYRKALQVGPSEPSYWRAEILRKMAAVIKPGLRFQEADDLYDEALAILGRAPDEAGFDRRYYWIRLQLDRQDLYYLQARVDDMEALTAEVEPLVHELDLPDLWSQYYASLTHVRSYQERFRLSSETVEIARDRLRYAKKSGNVREIAEQQFGLGFMLLWSGDLDSAPGHLRSALATCEKIGHTYTLLQCLAYLSIAHRLRGDVDQTRQYWQRAMQMADVPKHRYYVAVDHATAAWLAYKEREWPAAVNEATSALSLLDGTIYPFRWLAHWIIIARCLETGDLDAAAESAADVLSPGQQRLPDDVTAVLETLVEAVRSGDKAAGSEALFQALAVAKGYGYL